MKISKYFIGITVGTLVALSIIGTKVSATSNKCEVVSSGWKWGSFFTVKDNKATAKFTVKGENCTTVVSLVSWKTPSANGQPLYDQKIYEYTTKTFGPGEHALSVNLPDCFYQSDLMVGTKSDWAEADNTPKKIKYTDDGKFADMGLRDFILGGDKKCAEKPTPVPPTTTPPQVQTAATTLPETGLGIGSVIGFGLATSIVGYAAHMQWKKRYS